MGQSRPLSKGLIWLTTWSTVCWFGHWWVGVVCGKQQPALLFVQENVLSCVQQWEVSYYCGAIRQPLRYFLGSKFVTHSGTFIILFVFCVCWHFGLVEIVKSRLISLVTTVWLWVPWRPTVGTFQLGFIVLSFHADRAVLMAVKTCA